jgi:hypothetical protein
VHVRMRRADSSAFAAVSVKRYAAKRICRCRRRTSYYAADGGWLDVAGGRPSTRARQDRFGFVETESKESIGAVIEWLVDHST